MTTIYLLTGDIGGTNSRMGLYTVGNDEPLAVKTYSNDEHVQKPKRDGIFEQQIIAPFLEYCWSTVPNIAPIEVSEIVATLAIAGTVRHNKVHMTNLHGIEINGDAIARQAYNTNADPRMAAIKVCTIINDFVAQGYGCLTLQKHEVRELTPGSWNMVDPTGPKACVGAGTGLGECFLAPDEGGNYSCFPSEGGHVEWAPRTDLDVKMLMYLKKKFQQKDRISVERVVSGTGLANCYEFLAQEFPDRVNKEVLAEFLDARDLKGKVVGLSTEKCEVAKMAMETMITSYGSEVGSVGVKFIPTGGLYVTGGLTPKNIDWIEGQDSLFMKAYRDKGRVSPILEIIPLFAVMTEDLGVRGAVAKAQLEAEKYLARKAATSSG